MATLQMTPMMVDEETGEPVEPDTNKPVDQKAPYRPGGPSPLAPNPL